MTMTTGDLMIALRFLGAAREEPALREHVLALDPAEGLDAVVDVAAWAGFTVTVETLRAAHRHDWALRRARYVASKTIHDCHSADGVGERRVPRPPPAPRGRVGGGR